MSSKTSSILPLLVGSAVAVALGPASIASAQGPIFEQPFVVEHHMVQVDEHGDRFSSPPVVDTYGGSWIVSERADGTRLVVDLVRREMTEIRAENGTYSTLGFERLAEIMKRLEELEGTRTPARAAKAGKKSRTAADWTVREGAVRADHGKFLESRAAGLLHRQGVRHLTLRPRSDAAEKSDGTSPGSEDSTIEMWVDPSMKIGLRARAALADFERSALGTEGSMEAAREFADGAIPIRTVRGETKADGSRRLIEDVVIRLEKLERFDTARIAVPEGLRKVPHPLEGLMAYMEKEAERERMMSGAGSVSALESGDDGSFAEAQSFTNTGSGGNE